MTSPPIIPAPLSIPRDTTRPPAQDFAALKAEALERLPVWCSGNWTDFNDHDPGIIILEQITYALTDLSYRASLPVAQILPKPDGTMPWEENSLYAPTQILPMNPLTATDYARLLYDRIPGLIYAAVTSLDASTAVAIEGIGGRFQVTLSFDPDTPTAQVQSRTELARAVLNQVRNLGETFERVDPVAPIPFTFSVLLELEPGHESEIALANLYFAVKQAVLPRPQFIPLSRATQAAAIEQVMSGPLLERGVLRTQSLPRPLSWFEVKERTVRALSSVPGVKAIDDISFADDDRFTADAIAGRTGLFAPSRKFNLEVKRPKTPDPDAAAPPTLLDNQRIQMLIQAGGQYPDVDFSRLLPAGGWTLPKTTGTSDLERYFSIQNHFPRCFGLHEDGLPPDATVLRRAQAQQLKGYLLVFEQLMANYFAQLSHTRDFFSNRPQLRTTFVQSVRTVPDVMPLLTGFNEQGLSLTAQEHAEFSAAYWDDPQNPYVTGLHRTTEDMEGFIEQRTCVLDHLLARFGECFPRTSQATYETIANQESLLQAYPAVSKERATGINLMETLDPRQTRLRSGLEEKMRLLLRRDGQRWGEVEADNGDSADETYSPRHHSPFHDYYFAIEHVVFLPRTTVPSATTVSPAPVDAEPHAGETVALDPAVFSFQLTHVLINWTVNPLTPSFTGYVENLIADNAPAHLWNRFYWFETLPHQDPAVVEFRMLYARWAWSGYGPLELSDPAHPVIAGANLVVKADTPAARLFTWLMQRINPTV